MSGQHPRSAFSQEDIPRGHQPPVTELSAPVPPKETLPEQKAYLHLLRMARHSPVHWRIIRAMDGKHTVVWTNPANEAQLWAGGWPSMCSSPNMTDSPSRCDMSRRADASFVQLAGEFYDNLDYCPGSWHTLAQAWSQGGEPPPATTGPLTKAGLGESRRQLMPYLHALWPISLDYTELSMPTKAQSASLGPWLSQTV